jgi:hypothetical protein
VSDVDSIRAQYEPVTHVLLFRCEFVGNNIHSGGSKTVKCLRNKELPHSSYEVIHATGQDAMRAGDSKRKGSANVLVLRSARIPRPGFLYSSRGLVNAEYGKVGSGISDAVSLMKGSPIASVPAAFHALSTRRTVLQ